MAVLALFIGAPWVVFTGIAKVKAAGQSASGPDTLRRSELQALVAEAVDEATAPLVARIETLEAIVTDDEPAGRLDRRVLDEALDDPEPLGAAAGRARVRS